MNVVIHENTELAELSLTPDKLPRYAIGQVVANSGGFSSYGKIKAISCKAFSRNSDVLTWEYEVTYGGYDGLNPWKFETATWVEEECRPLTVVEIGVNTDAGEIERLRELLRDAETTLEMVRQDEGR